MKVIGVAAGITHSAAITSQDKTFTFGKGSFGELGHGTRKEEMAPVEVAKVPARARWLQREEDAFLALNPRPVKSQVEAIVEQLEMKVRGQGASLKIRCVRELFSELLGLPIEDIPQVHREPYKYSRVLDFIITFCATPTIYHSSDATPLFHPGTSRNSILWDTV